jgi:YfiH family protein
LTTTRTPAIPGGRFGWNLAEHVDDEPAAVAAGRELLAVHSAVAQVQWLNQVHGRHCVRAGSPVRPAPQADAAWTTEPGLGVAVLTADCVPVVVCDRGATVVGVAHGGWRGLVDGVLDSLLDDLPVAPSELIAWLGPAIGPASFEVGDDVIAAVAALPDGAALLAQCRRPSARGRHLLDLFTLSEGLLRRQGVSTVYCERLCTVLDGRFHSYRRDGATGRMATLAWLREQ